MGADRRLLRVLSGWALVLALATGCVDTPPSSTTAPATSGVAVSTQASPSTTPTSPPSPSPSSASPLPIPTGSPSTPPPPAGPTVATVLAGLTVAPERRAGYKRTLFRLWIDADKDGCDTREEVLIADAVVPATVSGSCTLSGGQWFSPYDDKTFTDPGKLDIDHMVPLAEAWDSGAYAWTSARRKAYANDLGVSWALIAVSAAANRSKGDKDPAEWLPPAIEYTCRYLAVWVAIKARWDLAVDPAEKAAIAGQTSCEDTPVPAP